MYEFSISYTEKSGKKTNYERVNFTKWFNENIKLDKTELDDYNSDFYNILIVTKTKDNKYTDFWNDDSVYYGDCEFYLLIKKNITSVEKLNIKVKREEWSGEIYPLKYDPKINDTAGYAVKSQNLIYIKANKWNKINSLDVDVNINPYIKLTLNKLGNEGKPLAKADFQLKLENVASIKNYQLPTTGTNQNLPKTIYVTTNESGNIILEDIEVADLSKDVIITLTEEKAPVGYKKINGTIKLVLKRNGSVYTINNIEANDVKAEEFNKEKDVTLENNELKLNIKDIPVMNLGGIVWYEDEKIDKDPTQAEEVRKQLKDVTVILYKGDSEVARTTSSDGTKTATYTNHKGDKITVNLAEGEYMFTDIPAGDDYKVVFEYDGINYQAITNSEDKAYTVETTRNSKIKIEGETDRAYFNTKTKTIYASGEVDKSLTTEDGWIIEYDTTDPNKAIYKAVKDGEGKQQYVHGETYTYLKQTADWMGTWNEADGTINKSHYAFDINCGLNKKYFDLSLGTDVESATVKINGNQTTYSYDQILDGKLDEALNKSSKSSDSEIEYNLYLANSDYYYRISDYKVPGDDNGEPIENGYDENTDYKEIKDNKDGTELEIYVTYKLVLKNQSTAHKATVNAVEYHYDKKYQYYSIENAGAAQVEGENTLIISGIEDISKKPIEIKFKVKDENNNKCKLDTDYLNQAEIISYTTEGGLVDADSAPGNAFLNGTVRYEDDTDEANGIQIKLKDNSERSISGKVFDIDNNNTPVDDVIVQLIELVPIKNNDGVIYQYEYIWQETVSGSNTVKTTARNGYTGPTYNVSNDTGEYKFTKRIIPGNYIVRFIYGDGRTYDITENTLKYNGEDYKSTYVNYNYNADWYNNSKIEENLLLESPTSKAVDNEARRLKVMSYAVYVDGTKGAELAKLDGVTNAAGLKEVLSNTWMCAETLKIKMPVDADTQENTSDNTTVADGSNPTTTNTQFANVNFGLMERPKTKLVLEKHITGLTVKPVASGVNLIANATADINKILDATASETIELEGQQDGLIAIKSGRTNRGTWYLQTDTTELAQGADAYITYTYVIKNEGDEDYLNKDLVEFYNAVDIGAYANKLSDLEGEVKQAKKQNGYTNGTYISEFYYTGEKGENDEKVSATVEQIQETLNPKVSFVNSTTDFSKTDRDNNKNYAYYDTDGNLQENNKDIKEIITSVKGTDKLKTGANDVSRKLIVSVGLSASEIENDGVYDSYIAEVTHYTNAAGRRDQSTPANLSYVHSYDTNKTLKNYNEEDEFWAERFIITKPTGEDKLTAVQIAIISVSAVVILGVGIILIKKFVLKK